MLHKIPNEHNILFIKGPEEYKRLEENKLRRDVILERPLTPSEFDL